LKILKNFFKGNPQINEKKTIRNPQKINFKRRKSQKIGEREKILYLQKGVLPS